MQSETSPGVTPLEITPSRLLVIGPKGARRVVAVEERDVVVPLISLALHDMYRLGDLIYAGPEYGTQMEAHLTYQWYGGTHDMVGAAVPVDFTKPKIIVPLGFFGRTTH